MKILITGGAGYLGSVITRNLLKKHEVIVYDNLMYNQLTLTDLCYKKNFEFVYGDVRDYTKVVCYGICLESTSLYVQRIKSLIKYLKLWLLFFEGTQLVITIYTLKYVYKMQSSNQCNLTYQLEELIDIVK